MDEKLNKWLPRMQMADLDFYMKRHGDTNETRITFYQTFLLQSDKKVLQHTRELSMNIQATLSDEEYLELEKVRQYCVEQIRKIEKEAEV